MLRKISYLLPVLSSLFVACIAAESGEADVGSGGSGGSTAGNNLGGTATAGTSAGEAGKAGGKAGQAGGVGGKAGMMQSEGGTGGTDPFGGGGQAGSDPFGGGGTSAGIDCSDPFNEFEDCDDGDPCTTGEWCYNGLCGDSFPKSCKATDPCNAATCDSKSGGCVESPKADGATCDAGIACVTGGTCTAGKCEGGAPKDCSVFTSGCKVGKCDPAKGGCFGEAVPDGGACDDKNKCTLGDVCTAGVCKGTIPAPYTVLNETFANDPPVGWVFGPGWEVGVAKMSTCDFAMGNTPPDDYTAATMDKRHAGNKIGGCMNGKMSAMAYLESPEFDASMNPTEPLYLTYAHQNSFDTPSEVKANIEVWNGTEWKEVWKGSGGSETSWLVSSIDVGMLRNSKMKVRFGYGQLKTNNLSYAGWSLDDVQVGVPACMTSTP